MAPFILKCFTLPIDCDIFYHKFWHKSLFFERFLIEKLHDVGVHVENWTSSVDIPFHQHRVARSFHPSKISFPGLPSHAESIKNQSIELQYLGSCVESVTIKEINSFRGIPYCDYFHVLTQWEVKHLPCDNNSNQSDKKVEVKVTLDFKFFKSTWLQGTIESNTKAELMEVMELWLASAVEYLQHDYHDDDGDDNNNNNISTITGNSKSGKDVESGLRAPPTTADQAKQEGTSNKNNIIHSSPACQQQQLAPSIHPPHQHDSDEYDEEEVDSDEDEGMFYDCEQGEALSQRSMSASSFAYPAFRSLSSRSSKSAHGYNSQNTALPPTPPELRRIYSQPNLSHYSNEYKEKDDDNDENKNAINYRPLPGLILQPGQNSRDVAVQVVEMIFVLIEYFFWQVYQFYCYDLKKLFDIEPERVMSRCFHSFIPGWHAPILLHPDLYGPLLNVIALPQVILICTETSKHGCSPTSQLGNAIVVSFFLWIGLGGLYKLLSAVVAPSIQYKQCLSMVGYSFCGWNLALLVSLPLEHYNISYAFLPLIIFGIPSSIAQGFMFWEHTPASSLTLQPSSLPTSLQGCATQHARCLQRILWALPKITAFVLVMGTHYQLLWYLNRTFLPGRRHMCQLSALIQPSKYADILSQKELRQFAMKLFSGSD